jgi:hypothetical protein
MTYVLPLALTRVRNFPLESECRNSCILALDVSLKVVNVFSTKQLLVSFLRKCKA